MLDMDDEVKAQQEMQQEIAKYTRAGVLSFLEQEWLSMQEEKEKWESERIQLLMHIQRLEKERKTWDNIKLDLLKRIKMLEYALVQERAGISKSGTEGTPLVDKSTLENIQTPIPRPLRQRKGILQKYMQEFDNRTQNLLLTLNAYTPPAPQTESISGVPSSAHSSLAPGSSQPTLPTSIASIPDLTQSIVPENDLESADDGKPAYPTIQKRQSMGFDLAAILNGQKPNTKGKEKEKEKEKKKEKDERENGTTADKSTAVSIDSWQQDSVRKKFEFLSPSKSLREESRDLSQEKNEKEIKEKLKGRLADLDATEKKKRGSLGGLELLDKILEKELPNDSVQSSVVMRSGKTWQPAFTLRHHLDVVRCVSFHEDDPILISASDDCTLKLWNWRAAGTVGFSKLITSDVEPVHTFFGHTGPVLSVILSSSKEKFFSAGADGTVRMWELPDPTQNDPYAEKGKAINYDLAVFKGHADGIWDLSLHPHSSLLLSASADGTVKLWDFAEEGEELKSTIEYPTQENKLTPTSVAFLPTDSQKFVAGYTSSSVLMYDTETSKCTLKMHARPSSPLVADYESQINKLVAHPTMPLVVTAHEDRTVKFWDLRSGELTHSMVGHQEAVSSLAIDPTGTYLATSGHGCSIRFWDILSKSCLQEINAHRQKYDEGIYCVAYHPSQALLASGGADSTIKVYQEN